MKILDVKQEEDEYMTKNNRKQYTKHFPGYTCIDELWKGNGWICKYKEQPLCEDIGCDDQAEGECMTKHNYKQYAKILLGYTRIDEFYKGNDCVCKYKKQ